MSSTIKANGKEGLWSFQRPRCGVVRWLMCGASGPWVLVPDLGPVVVFFFFCVE